MSQEALTDHYNYLGNILKKTDNSDQKTWFWEDQIEDDILCQVAKQLDLSNPDSVVVDLGAGTCRVASKLASILGLTKPIICVDPSLGMLSNGLTLPNVLPICMNAEEFALKMEDEIDAIVSFEAVHHFGDDVALEKIFTNLRKNLSEKGKIVIEKPSEVNGVLPIVTGASEKGCKSLGLTTDRLIRVMQKCGFSQVQRVQIGPYKLDLNLEQLFSCMRARYASTLLTLSDEDIESGIEEMRRTYANKDSMECTLQKDLVIAIK